MNKALLLVWGTLVLVACNTFGLEVEPSALPDAAATSAMATSPSRQFGTGQRPTSTSVLDGGHLSFNDPVLGLSLDIPLWWETQAAPGAMIQFFQQDHTGARRAALTIAALSPESDSLDAALEEALRGAWGMYIQDIQPVRLGAFEALRLDLSPGKNRPPAVWLMVAPSGRGVSMMPGGDPDWIEPMTQVALDTLRPIDVVTPAAPPTITRTPIVVVPSERTEALTPFCRPAEAALTVSVAAAMFQVGQVVPVTVTLFNGATSGANLGQVQYTLNVQPLVFAPEDLRPLVHPVSIPPGGTDESVFLLAAVAPGPAMLTAAASYEMHALDYSWGSWSGCESSPLEIVVTPYP